MKVLIVIDAQEDFVRGPLGTEEAVKALPVIHRIVQRMDELENLVLFTMDTHDDNYLNTQEGKMLPVKHCIRNTHGWEICPEATCGKKHYINIEKSSFGFTKWKEWFTFDEDVEFYLCGFCTDICVMANFQILKALCPENPIFIIEDACAGVTPELHEAALEVMKSCQAYVISSREFEVKLLTDKPVDSKKTAHTNNENDRQYDHTWDMYLDEFEDAEN